MATWVEERFELGDLQAEINRRIRLILAKFIGQMWTPATKADIRQQLHDELLLIVEEKQLVSTDPNKKEFKIGIRLANGGGFDDEVEIAVPLPFLSDPTK